MEAGFTFPGAFRDRHGTTEEITWRVRPVIRRQPPGLPGYQIQTVIRGVRFSGYGFDDLEPGQPDQAAAAGLSLDSLSGDLAGAVLLGDLPCTIEIAGGPREAAVIKFTLTLPTADRGPARIHPSPGNLRLTIVVADEHFEVTDDWLEDGLLRLNQAIQAAGARLICCVTCLYSDYSPAGHGLAGMRCHRGAKSQYLAVKSKHDYWSVPVTEDVLETYLCPEYATRIPGTGYRG